MSNKKWFGRKSNRGIGRGLVVIVLIFGVIFYLTTRDDKQQPNSERQVQSADVILESSCFEDDFHPDPEEAKVLSRAWKIVRDNKIQDPTKIPPEKKLVILDGEKEVTTSLGDDTGHLGPYVIAWHHEHNKMPLRHRIICK